MIKKNLKILHLEDVSSDAVLVSNKLKKSKLDCEILVVDTKDKFIKALKKYSPDIILADHSLPSFNSIEALAILQKTGLKIPFIVVTATMPDEFAADTIIRGADDYIIKDRLNRLPTAIHNALEKFRLKKKQQNSLDEIIKKEKHYHALIENSNDAIVIFNLEGKPTYVSRSIKRVLGYTEEEAMQLGIYKIVYPDDREALSNKMADCLEKPGVCLNSHVCRIKHKNGSWRWVEATMTNMLHDPAINGIVDNFRDITERRMAELNLAESEKNLHQVLYSATDSFYVIDRKGYVTLINKTASENLEIAWGKPVTVGTNILNLIPNENEEPIRSSLVKVFAGETVEYELPLFIKNLPAWLQVNYSPVKDDTGAIVGAYIVTKDITELKKADEENKFKANLLNTIGQAAIATDLNGIVKYWNRAAENMYGWTKEEALGKNIIDLTTSEATNEQAIQIMEELKKGQTWSGEFRVRKKDGTNFPALVTNSPIYDENNILSGIIGISSDMTEKKKLEELLDKSNRLAAIGSFEIDVVNNTVFWSDITKEIREVEPDFIPQLNDGISYFKGGRDKEIITQRVKDCIEKGIAWDDELEITTHKGNCKWVRTIGEGEFVDGKCVKVYGSFQDINARKNAELEALKVYEEKNSILESIGDGFYALDKNWVITYWNKQAEILLKKSRIEAIGKNLWELYPDAKKTISYINYHNAVEEKTIQHYERFNEELDLWLEVSAYPSNTGLSVFFKDITDRKLSEIQLSALNAKLNKHINDLAISNKELEDFAYVASHDLQEPLRMVTGFLGQIEKKYSNIIDDKGKQYIHFAVDGAQRMRQIILDLLEFSRVGKVEEKEENIDLNDTVREIIVLCQKQIKEVKAIIKFENLPLLRSSKTALRQVFQNLVSNALKYHKKDQPPVIDITAEETETHWQFAIIDNGIGIEEEYFNKIFIIFQRLHNKDEYTGTGIGLAVCKKIIENLGGKIWLESEENKGSRFYFTIPKK